MRLLRCSDRRGLTAGEVVLRFYMTEGGTLISHGGEGEHVGAGTWTLTPGLKAGTEIRLAAHSTSSSPLRRGFITGDLLAQNGSSPQG
ncbi:hypothetical protein AGR4A_Cc50234 [Agrobacterium tumefaciens str. B6]|uniref:Uncharacterized protein n=1 Tax=Agrobacterium tumefaciens str. B6 TaxID=1183423 RepID=A0A822V0P8_AGRTU|nr:hypothetical protein AGR4A_Cc50234 [Agrobacterium tumefaciens str. B6]